MSPDDNAVFRCARLLLLLDLLYGDPPEGVDAERIGIYDFLAGHPLLLAAAPDDPDRLTLQMTGFDDRAVDYASPGQRLATAQSHLQRDLTTLVSTGMAALVADGRIRYRITAQGREAAAGMNASYARSYTIAARIVLRRLRRLSGRKLREALRRCTAASPSHPATSFSDSAKDTT